MNNINFGAIERGWDNRNIRYEEIAGAALFDWEKGFDINVPLKVENQNGSLSCVAQAWSKYGEVLNYKETGVLQDLSSKFIYSRIYQPSGGAFIYDGAKILFEKGCPIEDLVPSYNNGNPPTEDFMRSLVETEEILKNALIYKAKSHAYVNLDIDSFAVAMQLQNGLTSGYRCSYEGLATPIIRPPLQGEQIFGHAVYFTEAKLINGRKHLKFINSWGTGWGENGYGYLNEDYFTSGNMFNGITLVDLPNDWNKSQPFKYQWNRDLVYKETSQDVRMLQIALRLNGVFPATVKETGFYGNITKDSVYKFMLKYNIGSWSEKYIYPAGRRVGPKIRLKLNELYK